MSRLEDSVKNFTFGASGLFFGYVLNFATRKIFVVFLTIEYLGLNGLFSNILSILSFAELGIGTAICYSLYKPLAFKEIEKIQALMQLYRKAYTFIGTFIIVVGISLTPVLPLILGEVPDIPHINLIYCLFVLNSGISYFLSYKRTLLIADQKKYIDSTYRYGFQLFKYMGQILVLVLTRKYILFLLVMLTMTIFENISISLKVDGMYPYIKQKGSYRLSRDEKHQIQKNVYALMFHKLGNVIVNGTDNILVVTFANLTSAGIYANYVIVTSALTHIIGVIYTSVSASLGNLVVESQEERQLEVFNQLNFLTAWVVGFSSICLLTLFNPFITLWLGAEYLFSIPVVSIIVTNFYLFGMLKPVRTFYSSMGLFWYDRYVPIFESVINLGVSIFLAQRFGIIGVFIGTTVSTLATCFWFEPYVVFHYGLKLPVGRYFISYIKYAGSTIFIGWINYSLVSVISLSNQYLQFLVAMAICTIIPNLLFWVLFSRMEEFSSVHLIVKKIIRKTNKKR